MWPPILVYTLGAMRMIFSDCPKVGGTLKKVKHAQDLKLPRGTSVGIYARVELFRRLGVGRRFKEKAYGQADVRFWV